jgi:aldehyde dehydrogenase (NAD+)
VRAIFESINPYNGEVWAEVPRGTADDVDAAVRAAHAAFRSGPWATMTASKRGMALHKIGDAIAAHAEELADLEVKDNGKLKAEMLKQMPISAAMVLLLRRSRRQDPGRCHAIR